MLPLLLRQNIDFSLNVGSDGEAGKTDDCSIIIFYPKPIIVKSERNYSYNY